MEIYRESPANTQEIDVSATVRNGRKSGALVIPCYLQGRVVLHTQAVQRAALVSRASGAIAERDPGPSARLAKRNTETNAHHAV
jgi:hypothetical protein